MSDFICSTVLQEHDCGKILPGCLTVCSAAALADPPNWTCEESTTQPKPTLWQLRILPSGQHMAGKDIGIVQQ